MINLKKKKKPSKKQLRKNSALWLSIANNSSEIKKNTQTHTQTPHPATLCPGNEVIFFSPLLPRAFESSSLVSEIRGLLSACNR
uniref:HDC02847 n=1 Tax=Drosophila melanogaster TaxID=7227 RepID=Q6IHB2_DROME|nr:TPA_inf: HDC02847 [Drosophila melanogaster]